MTPKLTFCLISAFETNKIYIYPTKQPTKWTQLSNVFSL